MVSEAFAVHERWKSRWECQQRMILINNMTEMNTKLAKREPARRWYTSISQLAKQRCSRHYVRPGYGLGHGKNNLWGKTTCLIDSWT